MKLYFDPNQQYHIDAINAVIGVFEGQPLSQGDFSFTIDNKNYEFQEGGVPLTAKIEEKIAFFLYMITRLL